MSELLGMRPNTSKSQDWVPDMDQHLIVRLARYRNLSSVLLCLYRCAVLVGRIFWSIMVLEIFQHHSYPVIGTR